MFKNLSVGGILLVVMWVWLIATLWNSHQPVPACIVLIIGCYAFQKD